MKKLLFAILLLLGCLAYMFNRLTKSKLYLPKFSYEADNPVSFHWNYIGIDTGFVKGDPNSIYQIWITPIYIAVLVAITLSVLAFLKKK
ncbi:hypothetical protein O2313_15395 [Bacillus amyloliquefaciens]|uniref:hypothetical protein n=1 Tax=Bacillus amyloliquefaciens TaxID=1390 RepID=UPI0022B01282|nr:hypothetical protein [Bacillus amyloliquefaciens]MCZ4248906.1 hypothetical protein [Bacillus amyloliquefaciens]